MTVAAEITATEAELRDMQVPTFAELPELTDYVTALTARSHDYGTCVYAMSMAATAAYNYVASKLGVTGFQASCADLDIIRRTRRYERFILLDLGNALYPQCDLPGKLTEALENVRPWLAEEAAKKIEETGGKPSMVSPSVLEHWQELAAFKAPAEQPA